MTKNDLKTEIQSKCLNIEEHCIKCYHDLDKECIYMNTICDIVLKYKNEFTISFFGDVINTKKDIRSNLYCGYYCPSPTCDILVGGLKRGKISNRAKTYTHEHGFDNDNKLIYTKTFFTDDTNESMTYYMYFKNLILQFTFDTKNELIEMAISRYGLNHIVSCCKSGVDIFSKTMVNKFDFAECYNYKNNQLYKQKSYTYSFINNRKKSEEIEYDIDESDEIFSKTFNRFFDNINSFNFRNIDYSKFFEITFFKYDSEGCVTEYKTFDVKNNEVFSAENFEVSKIERRKLT